MDEAKPVIANGESNYQQCLAQAMAGARELLREEGDGHDAGRMRSAKSSLDTAIERVGIESERLISAQELLRELLVLVALHADPLCHERHEAFKILEKLRNFDRSRGCS